MNFFDLFTNLGINVGVEEFRSTPNAILLDVRPKKEYDQGHVPGSINIPWGDMGKVMKTCSDLQAPIYIYCKNGNYSRQALKLMKRLGYKNLTNIGGIKKYRGELET